MRIGSACVKLCFRSEEFRPRSVRVAAFKAAALPIEKRCPLASPAVLGITLCHLFLRDNRDQAAAFKAATLTERGPYLFSSELRRSEPTIIYDHPKPEYLFFAYRVMNSFNVGKQLRDRSSESRHSQHPIL